MKYSNNQLSKNDNIKSIENLKLKHLLKLKFIQLSYWDIKENKDARTLIFIIDLKDYTT
jgi:hypothetical protein